MHHRGGRGGVAPLAILIKWRIAKKSFTNRAQTKLLAHYAGRGTSPSCTHPLRMLQPCPLFILYPILYTTLYHHHNNVLMEYEFVGKHLCFYVPTNNYYREEELSYQSQVEKVISLWSRYSVCLKQAESQLHLLMHCCTVCIEFILTGLCIMPYAYYVLCIHGQVKWFSLTIVPSNLVPYSIMCMYIQMFTAN